MRSHSRLTVAVILLITVVSAWLALPSDWLNIAGAKDNIYVHQGLDLQGGLQVVLEARPPEGQSVGRDELVGTRDTIERRVGGLGVSEPLIQTRGSNQIVVELPGVDDPQQAVDLLKQTALLEIIDPQGQYLNVGTRVNTSLGSADQVGAAGTPGTGEATPGATPEATPGATAGTDQPVSGPTYTTIVSGADLDDAFPTQDSVGSLVVGFRLKPEAADKFYQYTSTHIGQPMSIVVDKTVINTATIQDAISNEGIINGLSSKEVTNLVLQLKSGALSVPLEVVQSRTIGPSLGQDSIDKSIIAGIVGLGLVALMMILYYRLPGLLSVVALLIYTSIVFALFKLIPVTLTLAGIAGFILSIGMAVDANVLIFAPLKDELRLGRPLPAAIQARFPHAWPAIRDSNVSTMITCAILFWFGRYTGASIIQGFALTLFIGVVVSMFTAIVVTRNMLRILLTIRPINDRWWLGVDHGQGIPAGAE
ncbi:MAG TPA: protein translocase subunit SecD [Thermomicrobiales bacterium]|nr:protein translocase subunit SecD [Thermomicrobiales bacterium]